MDGKNISFPTSLNLGIADAVAGGVLMKGVPLTLTFVADDTERDTLENILPGQIVATYGLGTVWQKSGDGTWIAIKGGE